MRNHAPQCGWHCDQYDFECNCGVARPATLSWAESELLATVHALKDAIEAHRLAYARVREMRLKS